MGYFFKECISNGYGIDEYKVGDVVSVLTQEYTLMTGRLAELGNEHFLLDCSGPYESDVRILEYTKIREINLF